MAASMATTHGEDDDDDDDDGGGGGGGAAACDAATPPTAEGGVSTIYGMPSGPSPAVAPAALSARSRLIITLASILRSGEWTKN